MNICVFGSSSEQIDKIYLESAEHLGKKIAEKGYNLVFGAGKYGVMGASARGAYSAGGYTIGVTPDFFIDVGVVFDKCSELIVTDTMRERKGIMEDKADAFVICAGGMGTFEEFFEVLTLKQLNRHTKPIIIYNVKATITQCLQCLIMPLSEKFMTNACNRLYTIADTEMMFSISSRIMFRSPTINMSFLKRTVSRMADQCEFCANFCQCMTNFGDYCNINLDEDEMARFLTRSTEHLSLLSTL